MKQTGILFLAALTLSVVEQAAAQRLYFPSGDLEWSEVTLTDGKIQRRVRQATGAEQIQSLPASSVVRVDWPYPAELHEALDAIIRGKYDEALGKANEVREIHKFWKDKPGSWYVPATLMAIEAYIRKGSTEGEKLVTELRAMTLPAPLQIGVTMVDAMQDYQKGITGPALQKVSSLVKATDDSAMLARFYTLIGDIQFKREAYVEALDAYLQVPVFYGAQASLLPAAELGAARCLIRLRRLEDASSALGRVAARYKGSVQAAAAEKDKIDVDKALGAADTPDDDDGPKDGEEKKAGPKEEAGK